MAITDHLTDSRTVTEAHSLAEKIAALEAQLEELRRQQLEALVEAIEAVVEYRAFDARALWSRRWTSRELLEAFDALHIQNAQQLGKRLRRLRGHGLERIGADKRGAIWIVVP